MAQPSYSLKDTRAGRVAAPIIGEEPPALHPYATVSRMRLANQPVHCYNMHCLTKDGKHLLKGLKLLDQADVPEHLYSPQSHFTGIRAFRDFDGVLTIEKAYEAATDFKISAPHVSVLDPKMIRRIHEVLRERRLLPRLCNELPGSSLGHFLGVCQTRVNFADMKSLETQPVIEETLKAAKLFHEQLMHGTPKELLHDMPMESRTPMGSEVIRPTTCDLALSAIILGRQVDRDMQRSRIERKNADMEQHDTVSYHDELAEIIKDLVEGVEKMV